MDPSSENSPSLGNAPNNHLGVKVKGDKRAGSAKTLVEAFRTVPALSSKVKKLVAYKKRADAELLRLRKELTKLRLVNAETAATNAELQIKVDELADEVCDLKCKLNNRAEIPEHHVASQTSNSRLSGKFSLKHFNESFSEDEASMHSAINKSSMSAEMNTPKTHASEDEAEFFEAGNDDAISLNSSRRSSLGITPIPRIPESESFKLVGSGKSVLDKLSATSRRDVMNKFRLINGSGATGRSVLWSERKPPKASKIFETRSARKPARDAGSDDLRTALLRSAAATPRSLKVDFQNIR